MRSWAWMRERGGSQQAPLLTSLRRHHLFLRATALVVAVAFLNLYLQPLALAANLPDAPEAQAPREPTNEEKLSKNLEAIESRLGALQTKLERGEDASAEKQALQALRQELNALDVQAIADFDAIEARLKEKNLPDVILNRHYEAVNQYKQEMSVLRANLDELDAEPTDEGKKPKAQKAKEHLKAKQKKKGPKTQFDPNDLPNKAREPNPENKPKLTPEAFTRAGLHSNPYVKLAAHGTYTFDRLAGASDPAYLAATTEVVLTPAIVAKAEELQHDPVAIYNWVRNNVEWLPTFGAAQDAEITLGSQRGNAFDIASLLIALLRASGIPARYVHGAIEVPEDKFRNWAGGFNSISAAANYASSGGIPITGVVTGGQITKVQMEHVWVEAAIDFQPSRGAVNRSADTWVALDPSYKQYEYLQGLDVVAISGLDPEALAQSFVQSSTSNTAEGWVSGLNSALLADAQTQAQMALQAHIENNMTNPTVGDVIGGRRIVAQTASVLPTSLSVRRLITGARYATLPARLQNTYGLGFGIDILGDVNLVASFPWTRVNNHKLTLSFRPATAADEQTLASLLPAGSLTDPSQMPSSIPSYLISVVPEIALDGQVVGQGSAMRLGEDLDLIFEVSQVGHGPIVKSYKVPAGAYLSLSAIQGSVSPKVLENMQAKVTHTKTVLETADASLINSLTREDVLGDMFQVGTLGYWGQYITLARTASLAYGAKHGLAAGFGSLGYEPNVDYFFGFPRAITPGGIGVNVWVADINADNNGDAIKRKNFQLKTGTLSSALEHAVPEQMFAGQTQTPQGVSAVKALQIASNQGQRLYHITPANRAQALPNLHLDGLAMQEITAALSSGKEVIAHTDRISVPGWTGEGYILFDPVTGAGAYKITGGNNGGFFGFAIAFIMVAALFFVTTGWIAVLVGVLAFIAHAILTVQHWFGDDPIDAANYASARFLTLVLATVLIIILEQIVFFSFPWLFIAAILLSAVAALFSILRAILTASFDPRIRGRDDQAIPV